MLWFTSRRTNIFDTAARLARSSEPAVEAFERLEERIAFYVGPMLTSMPPLSALENTNNTVVRMHTNMGNIDVELFNQTAPTTVENFQRYIREGRLDETFFHRLVPGFVLQGGGFTFHDGDGAQAVDTFAPIPNEFQRLNVEGTIAMARLGGDPNSATSQFYFNLVDNPNLDIAEGGYTVFGRVIQGWDVVQTIAGLQVRDLNQQLVGNAFSEVPTRANYDPNVGPTEASLVRVHDVEVIKTWGSPRFYTHATHISEGFHGAQVIERVDMHNMDVNIANFYQIIVRYENGIRDQVISSGVLQPGEKRAFKVADANFPAYEVVRPNEPYAIEVRSTRALGASLNRRDFGATISESFINVMGIRHSELLHWRIPGGEKGADMRSFVTWQNLTSNTVTLYVLLRSEDGTTSLIPQTVEAFRRGGLEVHNIGVLPEGRFSVQINAVGGAIIAGLTQYQLAGAAGQASASLMHGSFAGGSTHGALAGAIIPSDGEAFVDLFYTAQEPAQVLVNLSYFLTDGTTETTTVILNAIERSRRVNLGEIFPTIPADQFFSLLYAVQADAAPVAGQFVSSIAGDESRTSFQTHSTPRVNFADGYTDPNLIGTDDMNEVISLFNPMNFGAGANFTYEIFYQFSDGQRFSTGVKNLAPRGRVDHRAWDIPAVQTKILSNPAFRFYAVEVVTTDFGLPPVTPTAAIAQLTRTHNTWQQSLTTQPSLNARFAFLPMTLPQFI